MRILFVCMGNICRSPTAEGVFVAHVKAHGKGHEIHVDSAGTHGYHIGAAPDPRSRAAALRRGYDLSGLRARAVVDEDFERFDLLLAMDRHNLDWLAARCPDEQRGKLGLFLECAPELKVTEVPDPYYGGPQGFEHVLDLIEVASLRLLARIALRDREKAE